ncbi:unnamed protein product [Ixodes pacificus]
MFLGAIEKQHNVLHKEPVSIVPGQKDILQDVAHPFLAEP